jgi:phosphatidylglycerophosphatase A
MSADSGTVAPTDSDASHSSATAEREPRIALFIATACGLGYMPVAPGTWGSAAGIVLALLPWWGFLSISAIITDALLGSGYAIAGVHLQHGLDPFLWSQIGLALVTAALGVWSATCAAKSWQQKDPQRVVIDEVSGQHLTLLLGCGVPLWWKTVQPASPNYLLGAVSLDSPLNWKYLLLGFILFRVFDIWKPFPARQAESLPGGWGIMADDWVAGIYAAIGLWLARAAGL